MISQAVLNNSILRVVVCRTVKWVVIRKVLDDGLKLPEFVVDKNDILNKHIPDFLSDND